MSYREEKEYFNFNEQEKILAFMFCGADFSLQFSSRTQFAKISNKKVIAENKFEKTLKKIFLASPFSFTVNCPLVPNHVIVSLQTTHQR